MNLYEAIFLRKSIWNYMMEPVEKKTLDNVMNFANHLEMLSQHHRVSFSIVNNLDKDWLPIVSLSVKAPYYFVLYAQKSEDYLLNAGYLLEQVALYLTTKGLASCFLELHKMHLEDKDGYEPVLVLAFGKTEKSLHRDIKRVHRLKLDELCTFKTPVNENIKQILQAARYAPSVMNCQPWRFVIIENRIHVFSKKEKLPLMQYKKMKQVDIGMTIAHLLVAAEELWLNTQVIKSENISEKNFKKNEYITTVLITG